MEGSLSALRDTYRDLSNEAGSGPFSEKLRLEVDELQTSFSDVKCRLQSQNSLLSETLQQTEQLEHDISDLNSWISSFNEEKLQKNLSVKTSDQLSDLETEYAVVNVKC